MTNKQNKDFLDTVLTLRGHQITLRQAIAEGVIKGNLSFQSQQLDIEQIDSRWFLDDADATGRANSALR
jgi:hypothetical protein